MNGSGCRKIVSGFARWFFACGCFGLEESQDHAGSSDAYFVKRQWTAKPPLLLLERIILGTDLKGPVLFSQAPSKYLGSEIPGWSALVLHLTGSTLLAKH